MKNYIVNGKQYQFEEGKQPAGAVEVVAKEEKKAEPSEKMAQPVANKARRAANKS